MIKGSYQTTIFGITTIVIALANAANSIAAGHPLDVASLIATISAGVGLIVAKDAQVTGGTRPAHPEAKP